MGGWMRDVGRLEPPALRCSRPGSDEAFLQPDAVLCCLQGVVIGLCCTRVGVLTALLPNG